MKSSTLFAALFAAFSTCSIAATDAPTADAALIKRQSQEFSDASASGDAKVLERYLDDRVIFMNETGEIATKHDIVGSAAPPAAGISHTLAQSDFQLELHGDTAVTSFTDNSVLHVKDQVYNATYRSIEVWMKKHGRWLMVASQTLTQPHDPKAIALSTAELDDYVGTYAAGTAATVKIERRDDKLFSATNGAPATELRVEARDVLFTPQQPRLRRAFVRDRAGHVISFLSLRDTGDIVFTRSG